MEFLGGVELKREPFGLGDPFHAVEKGLVVVIGPGRDVDRGPQFQQLAEHLAEAHLRPRPLRIQGDEAVGAVVDHRDVRHPG